MVRIIDALEKENKETGDKFCVLELMGEVEVVKSATTGKYYITARKCTIPSTFGLEIAQGLIGTSLAGSIKKVESDEPYDYTLEDGTVIQLEHRWEFVQPQSMEEVVYEHEVIQQPI